MPNVSNMVLIQDKPQRGFLKSLFYKSVEFAICIIWLTHDGENVRYPVLIHKK